jgi:hypothetical protein
MLWPREIKPRLQPSSDKIGPWKIEKTLPAVAAAMKRIVNPWNVIQVFVSRKEATSLIALVVTVFISQ